MYFSGSVNHEVHKKYSSPSHTWKVSQVLQTTVAARDRIVYELYMPLFLNIKHVYGHIS